MRDRWVTAEEAAEYACVSVIVVRRAVRAGKLHAVRVNGNRALRTKLAWVEEWMLAYRTLPR